VGYDKRYVSQAKLEGQLEDLTEEVEALTKQLQVKELRIKDLQDRLNGAEKAPMVGNEDTSQQTPGEP
jgi:chaperonin cofactor prefoldin